LEKFRKSRKSEKTKKAERSDTIRKQSSDTRTKAKNVVGDSELSTAVVEDMALSWHPNLTSSRAPPTISSAEGGGRGGAADRRSSSAHRRRRPRSAHYDPNAVNLAPERVSIFTV
uniref:DUF4005 domain-containing protein n=1 Tax=Anisakis simplex TaxID=6269 RepID=A0A0M3J5I6_ANISI